MLFTLLFVYIKKNLWTNFELPNTLMKYEVFEIRDPQDHLASVQVGAR